MQTKTKRALSVLVAAGLIPAFAVLAHAGLDGSFVLPLDSNPIRYGTRPAADPVTPLAEKLKSGEIELDYDSDTGYLPAVLRLLNVPVSSQVLVFSKTSFQAPRISPRTPRAIYYNDRIAVGYVKTGEVIEITATDPQQGTMFYTLDQEKTATPRIERRSECLECHASGSTLGVPGLLVRSVFPDHGGMPIFQAGSFITDHRSPLKERWGGWYVTGTHGSQIHMGNAMAAGEEDARLLAGKGSNVTDLQSRFDAGAYLSPHSDIVSLMVLEHQTRMTNLITRVNYETRMALYQQAELNKALGEPADHISDSARHRIENAGEELLRYLLFTEETALEAPVKGTSNFAKEFAARGPRDSKGRSLRDPDMTRRMFRYPCSYMIYSDAFEAIPGPAKEFIYRRLWEVLSGKDKSAAFANLSADDRRSILEILRNTKPNLPAYWKG